MRYYTDLIPSDMADKVERLGAKVEYLEKNVSEGWILDKEHPMTNYGEVLEWLMNRGVFVFIVPTIHPNKYRIGDKVDKWDCYVNGRFNGTFDSWQGASNYGIDVAIEILKPKKR